MNNIRNKENNGNDKGKAKLCLVSSSGGHWEQLQKLQPLMDKYEGIEFR